MRRFSVIAIGLVLISISARAEKYGMAGCGLGAMVFKDQPGKIQIVASLLNAIGMNQTSAMTTGTSNCKEDASEASTMQFIEMNAQALRKDISKGQGETLAGLLNLWECKDQGKIGQQLQGQFGAIYTEDAKTPYDLNNNIRKVLKENELTPSCHAIRG